MAVPETGACRCAPASPSSLAAAGSVGRPSSSRASVPPVTAPVAAVGRGSAPSPRPG